METSQLGAYVPLNERGAWLLFARLAKNVRYIFVGGVISEVGRYIFDRPNFSPLKLRSRRSPPIALAMKGFSPACCFAVLMARAAACGAAW